MIVMGDNLVSVGTDCQGIATGGTVPVAWVAIQMEK